MSRGKEFTTTEINEIRSLLKDGLTYAEVGELTGRSKKSIENLAQRQGWTKGRLKNEPDTDQEPAWNEILKAQEVKQEEPVLEMTVEEVVEEKATPFVKVEPVKEKTLNDYPARELIKNLYDRGYRIENGKLICIVHQVVNINDIIKNG